MNTSNKFFISDITVFEAFNRKYKPEFVKGREFCSLTYRHSGKISIICNENELISTADTVTFVPSATSYTTEVFEDSHITGIHFNFSGSYIPFLPAVINLGINSTHISALFQSLRKAEESSDHLLKLSLFYEILHELKSIDQSQIDRIIPDKISKAKRLIETRYSNPYFSIESLAEEMNVSTTYLRREFNLAYGIAPIKYLKIIRIKNAVHALLTDTSSVAQIAKTCGYTSTSYFIQDFHKTVGESPSQYRNRLRVTP